MTRAIGYRHTTKVCNGCGREKHRNEFYRDERIVSGLRSRCRDCDRARDMGIPVEDLPPLREKKRFRYRDQASLAEARGPEVPPSSQPIPHQVFVRIPLPARGALAFQLLNPPFQRGMR